MPIVFVELFSGANMNAPSVPNRSRWQQHLSVSTQNENPKLAITMSAGLRKRGFQLNAINACANWVIRTDNCTNALMCIYAMLVEFANKRPPPSYFIRFTTIWLKCVFMCVRTCSCLKQEHYFLCLNTCSEGFGKNTLGDEKDRPEPPPPLSLATSR